MGARTAGARRRDTRAVERWSLLPVAALVSSPAAASDFGGASLTLAWILPFAGMLASLALLPTFASSFWHRHFGKVALAWALAFAIPCAMRFGVPEAAHQIVHVALVDYLPFVVLLFTLYTVSGGIGVFGNLHGSPGTNTALLAIGAVLANVMGTTGATMVLVRPLIRANDNRVHNAHVFVFFIFIVANGGGSLTPLGDPPLFLGFLHGVDFFWTTRAMLGPTSTLCGVLLAMFYLLDRFLYAKAGEERPAASDPTPDSRLRIEGMANVLLLAVVVGAVLASGLWRPHVTWDVFGTQVALENVVRDLVLVAVAVVSLRITPAAIHEANGFDWGPMQEVAKLFAGIFVTIIPAVVILRAGDAGALAPLTRLVTVDGAPVNAMYFWLTGGLSAFLDNAPTYLVFFNLAGADARALMAHRETLEAISGGAVFMGAYSYIGNAPNFMVRAIAERRGVRMPSFGGYLLWSLACLTPVFVLLTLMFFR